MEITNKDERTWAVIAHLSGFAGYLSGFIHILGPLIIWLAMREGRPFVDAQAKEALNFQISFTIYLIVAVLLAITIVGLVVALPVLAILPIFHTVCMIIAAIKAADGRGFRYPLTIRLVQ